MPIHLSNRQRRFPVNTKRLMSRGQACLEHLGIGHGELSVLLVNDPAMRALNRDYRGIARRTDVLSFPLFDGPPEAVLDALGDGKNSDPGTAPNTAPNTAMDTAIGDVVISVQTAHRQAAEHGLPADAELALLLAHGILHLIGYDHELGASEAKAMAVREKNLLGALGLSQKGLINRTSSTGPRQTPRPT